ncbi:hypothetical protein C9374_004349 [Naegleria lovaniensis]|uniref:RNA ligase domain-containing protein n=1 Tax=Naegleria lovaniensis TaxID=51637 RepID=A0AA88GSJ9_NAELO|nr:uncharacterized protein C9374_004349 [Naegleria lovaniensis]KAG2383678.1 hypothetical protein C9374_004349 [Naegleria lovaniensis]
MPLILIDFVCMLTDSRRSDDDDHIDQLVEKLSQKIMSGSRRIANPFSQSFTLVHTIDKVTHSPAMSCSTAVTLSNFDDVYLKHPSEIRISYHHSCIIICDSGNHRLLFFDLSSKKFITTISMEVYHFCIQENYDHLNHDALLVISSKMFQSHCCLKYDLLNVMNHSHRMDTDIAIDKKVIWKSQAFQNVTGISISKKHVFISEFLSKSIIILDLSSGRLRAMEKSSECRVEIFSTNDSNALWKSVKSFGANELNSPKGICLDKSRGHILITDSVSSQFNRIQIFRDEQRVKSYFTNRLKCNAGMCLNEFTGELIDLGKVKCHKSERDFYALIPKYPSAQEKSSGAGHAIKSSKRWIAHSTYVYAQEKIDGSQLSFMLVNDTANNDDAISNSEGNKKLIFRTKKGPISNDICFENAIKAISEIQHLLSPNYVYRGETITRYRHCRVMYGFIPPKSFVLFDVQNDKGNYLLPDEIEMEAKRLGLMCAQIVYRGVLDFEKLKYLCNNTKSQLGGYAMVEGLVVKQYLDKTTVDTFSESEYTKSKRSEEDELDGCGDVRMVSFKMVSKRYKETKKPKHLKEEKDIDTKLKTIAQSVCTQSRWEKAMIRYLEEGGDINHRDLSGILCLEIKKDIIKEEHDSIQILLKECEMECTDGLVDIILEYAVEGVKEWVKEYVKEIASTLIQDTNASNSVEELSITSSNHDE